METDDDIMDSAYENCMDDLRKAERRVLMKDGSYNMAMLKNQALKKRVKFPDSFDRDGNFVAFTDSRQLNKDPIEVKKEEG